MAIRIQCPSAECRAVCSANESVSGRKVKCPKCGKPYTATPTFDGKKGDTNKGRSSSNEDPFPTLPAEFGRYRVLKLLGRGGMGAVYLAQDSQLGRHVALKIPFIDASKTQRIERFAREARSAAALEHPNICTVFDAGEIGGRPFITMAYINGTPLEQEIHSGVSVAQPRAAKIIRQVALALDYAHRNGIVHRDLKPANVMMRADGEPVVMDFGLAKSLAETDPDESKLTADGGIIGTPTYMSPEQVKGDAAVIGPASDIYALGVVLFELLSGTPPYTGSMGSMMAQILASPVPVLQEFRTDVDSRLDAICQRAMAKDPADRFRDMAELACALGAFLSAGAEPNCDVELVEPKAGTAPAPAPASFEQLDVPAVTRSSRARRQSGQTAASSEATVAAPRAPKRRVKPLWIAAVLVPLAVVALAVVVLRVETSNGTLVVEIDDPAVETRIKGGKLILSGPDGKDRYTLAPGERDKKIDAGPYKVRVEGADGLVLDTPEFTLKKGDKVTVKVTLEPKAVATSDPPKKDALGADPDRRAAEYVLSIGGVVRVNDEVDDIKTATDLPRKAFRLTHVDLMRNRKLTNAGLAAFVGCKDVKSLTLFATPLKDEGLHCFKDCKSLRVLYVGETQISDAGLAVFGDCKDLATLFVGGTAVSDKGLDHFKNCKSLVRIDVGVTQVRGPGLANFKDCKLEQLGIHNTRVTDEYLAHFKDCKSITILGLQETAIGNEGLAHFKGCKSLTQLCLHNTKITDAGLVWVQDCKSIESIDLRSTAVTAAKIAELRRVFPNCNISWDRSKEPALSAKQDGYVTLFNGKDLTGWIATNGGAAAWTVRDGYIEVPPGMQEIRTNAVFSSDFELHADFWLPAMANKNGPARANSGIFLHDRYEIQIFDSFENDSRLDSAVGAMYGVVPVDPEALKKAVRKPEVWNTFDITFRSPRADAKGAVTEPGRITVRLNGIVVINDAKFDKVTAGAADTSIGIPGPIKLQNHGHPIRFRNIEIKELAPEKKKEEGAIADPDRKAAEYVLSVGGQIGIGDEFRHVPTVGDLPKEPFQLTAAILSRNGKVNDAGLAAFAGCKHVKKLELFQTGPVTDVGLGYFKECTGLEELHIQHQNIGDKGLANFQGFKKLRVLWLHRTKITDTGLGYLKDSTELEYLALPGTDVTDAGVAHFKGSKRITTLSLGGTKVTDAGLANFSQCKRFDCLALEGLTISDTGLAHLKGCEVEVLLLEGCPKVTDDGLAHLGFANALRVWVNGTPVTDKTLARIAKSNRLADVRAERTKVTLVGVESLKKAHPGCAVVWDAPQKK